MSNASKICQRHLYVMILLSCILHAEMFLQFPRCFLFVVCHNGGSCNNDERQRLCTCRAGFDDKYCTRDVRSCGVCGSNTHECVIKSTHVGCSCKFPYTGFDCSQSQMSRIKCPKRYGISHDIRTVPDEKLEGSSTVNDFYNASQARLYNPNSAWCASSSDVEPTLTLSLGGKSCILGYAIQSDPTADNYVTAFKITRKLDEISNTFDTIATEQVTFESRNEVHKRTFDTLIVARAIKFVITSFEGDYACLRVELFGAPCAHSSPTEAVEYFHKLGVADAEKFPDGTFTSSSSRAASFKSFNGRLDGENAWCPSGSDSQPMFVLNLPQMQQEVVGLITQGYEENDNHARYYTVLVDNSIYTAGGKNTIFGNFDGTRKTVQFLDNPIPLYDGGKTVNLLLGDEDTGKCLRVELFACDRREPCHSRPCLHGGTCERLLGSNFKCHCKNGFSGSTCEEAECYENLDVPSQDVVVSSDKYRNVGLTKYRLDGPELWCTELNDFNNAIELVFDLIQNINGFSIGGSTDSSTQVFVKKFKVFSKLYYWKSWSPITTNGSEEFKGTMKAGQDRVDYILDKSILASAIRFTILEYNDEFEKCARVGVKGCVAEDFCERKLPCLNGGTCRLQEKKPFVCDCLPGFTGVFCGQNICKKLNCHYNATCGPLSSFTCQCNAGFQGNGTFCEE